MAKNPDEKMIQEKFVEYQMLEQQVKVVQTHIQTLDTKTAELESVLKALEDFEEVKSGKTVLVPLSQGIFFKAKTDDVKTFLVNVGNNVVVEKTLIEIKAMLLEQGKELEDYKEKFESEFSKMLAVLEHKENELKELVKE